MILQSRLDFPEPFGPTTRTFDMLGLACIMVLIATYIKILAPRVGNRLKMSCSYSLDLLIFGSTTALWPEVRIHQVSKKRERGMT
jgi:hypothetical protein